MDGKTMLKFINGEVVLKDVKKIITNIIQVNVRLIFQMKYKLSKLSQFNFIIGNQENFVLNINLKLQKQI